MADSEETAIIPCLDVNSYETNLVSESEKAAFLHNIKERLRHQKIQSILEHVGKHVPKPSSEKKETKAKCLRRVVLYMKYLLKKSEELKIVPESIVEEPVPKVSRVVPKNGKKRKNGNSSKKYFVPKINCRKAQIIFLKKFTNSSVEEFSSSVTPEINSCAEHNTSLNNVEEVKSELDASGNSVLCRTQTPFDEKLNASSMETAAVTSTNNYETFLPLDLNYLHNSNLKPCATKVIVQSDVIPENTIESALSENFSRIKNAFNSVRKPRRKNLHIRIESEPKKRRGRPRKNGMPACSKKSDNKQVGNDNVLFSKFSEIFRSPLLSSNAKATASMPISPDIFQADTNNSVSNKSPENSELLPENNISQIFSSSNETYSSLLSEFYPGDDKTFPPDFLSSSDATTIPSSNEFISDDADYVSLRRSSNSMGSPEFYPDVMSSGESKFDENKEAYETLSDIESIIQKECLQNSSFGNSSSCVPSSKFNADLRHTSNSEKSGAMSGFDFTYGVCETPSLLNYSFIPQPIGVISDDLFSFHSNAPEFYYMYPNNVENMPVLLSNDIIASHDHKFSPDNSFEFCESHSEPAMYSNAKTSVSYTCDTLKNVQIKQEIPDMLPAEEVSVSLNNLGNFSW